MCTWKVIRRLGGILSLVNAWEGLGSSSWYTVPCTIHHQLTIGCPQPSCFPRQHLSTNGLQIGGVGDAFNLKTSPPLCCQRKWHVSYVKNRYCCADIWMGRWAPPLSSITWIAFKCQNKSFSGPSPKLKSSRETGSASAVWNAGSRGGCRQAGWEWVDAEVAGAGAVSEGCPCIWGSVGTHTEQSLPLLALERLSSVEPALAALRFIS